MNPDDPRLKLLEGLSREKLIDLVMAFNHCYNHLEKKLSGGTYMGCLYCATVERDTALSELELAVDDSEGIENEMRCAYYDVDYDVDRVVAKVKKKVEERRRRFPKMT